MTKSTAETTLERTSWKGIPSGNPHGAQNQQPPKSTANKELAAAFQALKNMLKPTISTKMTGKIPFSNSEDQDQDPKTIIAQCQTQLAELLESNQDKGEAYRAIKSAMDHTIDVDQLCLWSQEAKDELTASLTAHHLTQTLELVKESETALSTKTEILALKFSILNSLLNEPTATQSAFFEKAPNPLPQDEERLNTFLNLLSILFTVGIANLIYGLVTQGESFWIGETLAKPLSSCLDRGFGTLFPQPTTATFDDEAWPADNSDAPYIF